MNLRKYQHEAHACIRAMQAMGTRAVCVTSPCGSGKTVLAAAMISEDIARGERVVFLAHRKELISQCFQKLIDYGVDRSRLSVIMGGDKRRDVTAQVQVASWQSLLNIELPPATRIYADECHTSLATTRLEILNHYRDKGALIVGLTASPWRGDGKGLGSFFERLHVVVTVRDLIEEGYLCPAVGWTIPEKRQADISAVPVDPSGDFNIAALDEAVKKKPTLVGDIVALWKEHSAGMKTIGFAINVRHSQEMTAAFVAAGIPAEHVDATTPADLRAAILGDKSRGIIGRLERGETLVVWQCNIATEGLDIPSCKCAILAAHTASVTRHVQMMGRVMRPWFDDEAVILDPSGNLRRHGLPQKDREYRLDGLSAKRKGEDGGKTCRACLCVAELWETVCPGCGAKFKGQAKPRRTMIRTEDGELVEFRGDDAPPTEDEKRAYWMRMIHVPKLAAMPGVCLKNYYNKYKEYPPVAWRRML